MAAQKKWNLQSFSINPQLFGTNQSYTITCTGQNNFIDLNDTSIILTLQATGPTGTVTVLRPTTAWITQMQTEIKYQTDRGQEIKSYPGYLNRGIAANMFEILEYSKPKFDMNTVPEFLVSTTIDTTTTPTFSAMIPLKFLCDPAFDAGLLNIDSINFQISWDNLGNLFTLPTGSSIICQKVDFKYPTITTTSSDVIPKHVREIPNRQVYIQTETVPAGNSSVTSYVTVAFPCSEMFYFFVPSIGAYKFNPNPDSIVTTHQLASMSDVFPQVSNYQASVAGGVTGGVLRHWDELMSIIGKDNPEFSNTLDFTNWLNNLRIYGIEVGVEQRNGQAFNFQAIFATPTTNISTCIMVFVGRGHI